MSPTIQLEAMAENALLLRFGDTIDITINERVQAAARRVREQWPEIECVPAYASLLLRFDPQRWRGSGLSTPHQRLGEAVLQTLVDLPVEATHARLIDIPVHYGAASGPDLREVARLTGLSESDVIARHTAVEYRVAMLGFAPGFPYLLGLDSALSVPRRTDPRQRVPAGSVALGGGQTGIYPDELPGGWQLVGRTPLRLFDAAADNPSRLNAGDRVRFYAIDEVAFDQLAAAEET